MYNEDYMYAIERSPEYLAHYGILGMKWGVRKAIKSGNSARLGRQYAKAQKKLAKLEKRAANSSKYARRAALMGAGAAAAGGLAATGTEGVRKVLGFGGKAINRAGHGISSLGELTRSSKNRHIRKLGMTLDAAGRGVSKAGNIVGGSTLGNKIDKWGKSHSRLAGMKPNTLNDLSSKYGNLAGARASAVTKGNSYATKMASDMARGNAKASIKRATKNDVLRIGAGVVGAGLAAGAAHNAYKAATAKKKAAKFKTEMNKAFAGTKYANNGNRQGKKRRRR